MDKIVLEVDDGIGMIYRNLTPESKQQFNEAVSLILKITVNNSVLPNAQKTVDEQTGLKAIAAGIAADLLKGYQQAD